MKLKNLSKDRTDLKNALHNEASSENWRKFSTLIHEYNRDIYSEMCKTKETKLRQLLPEIPTVQESKRVVRIPADLPLSKEEENLLEKGLSFVPVSKTTDSYKTLDDTDNLYRKIRLKAYFASQPDSSQISGSQEEEESSDLLNEFKKKKKKFTPKSGEFEAVDNYISTCKKEISKVNLSESTKKKNMSSDDIKGLQSLKRRNDVVIKPADKGGAVVVWRKDLYLDEGKKQLSDEQFYERLDNDQTVNIQEKLVSEIKSLIREGSLPDRFLNLLEKSPRCAIFYLLPKIHKKETPGRPVVSNIACPTYNISKFLSGFFKPFVARSSSYIKDTTQLLQKLDGFEFRQNSDCKRLFTMDVKGLYTNIPNRDGLVALKYHLERRQNEENEIPNTTILRLAELVLTENCMEFDHQYYKQISGTMMGTPFGPEYACCFMIYVEERFFDQYQHDKPSVYLRYIDDIFGISEMPLDRLEKMLEEFKHFHPALDYTVTVDKEVPMLDTKISIKGTKIATTLYTKPTDSHAYLQYSSSHPGSCKKGIPYSQFLRIRRICSEEVEYEKCSRYLATCFQRQGYPRYIVERQRRKAGALERKELLKCDRKEDGDTERLVFPITYHPTNVKVVEIIKSNFNILKMDDEVGDLFAEKPMVAYRREKNLRDILVRSKVTTQNPQRQTGGTSQCQRRRCLTCKHINSDTCVVGPRGQFTVRERFTCESEELVYAIECKKCGDIYVGETGRKLKERFREHRLDVINKTRNKEVGDHFNGPNHSVEDMSVMGLKHETGIISRKLEEQRIIGKLGCVLGGGMNTEFNFPQLLE